MPLTIGAKASNLGCTSTHNVRQKALQDGMHQARRNSGLFRETDSYLISSFLDDDIEVINEEEKVKHYQVLDDDLYVLYGTNEKINGLVFRDLAGKEKLRISDRHYRYSSHLLYDGESSSIFVPSFSYTQDNSAAKIAQYSLNGDLLLEYNLEQEPKLVRFVRTAILKEPYREAMADFLGEVAEDRGSLSSRMTRIDRLSTESQLREKFLAKKTLHAFYVLEEPVNQRQSLYHAQIELGTANIKKEKLDIDPASQVFLFGDKFFYMKKNTELSADTTLKSIDGKENIHLSYHGRALKIATMRYDAKHAKIYILTNNSRIIVFKKLALNRFGFDYELPIPLVSKAISIDLNSKGDLFIHKINSKSFYENHNNFVMIPYRRLAHAMRIKPILDDGLGVMTAYRLNIESDILPDYQLSTVKDLSELELLDSSFAKRVSDLGLARDTNMQVHDYGYYYQGYEPTCASTCILNILKELGLDLDKDLIEKFMTDFYEYIRENPFIRVEVFLNNWIRENLAKRVEIKHTNIKNINSLEDKNWEAKSRYNARQIKNVIDRGGKLYLPCNWGKLMATDENADAGHAVAVIGYQINGENMDILLLDSNQGFMKIGIEHLSYSLQAGKNGYSYYGTDFGAALEDA